MDIIYTTSTLAGVPEYTMAISSTIIARPLVRHQICLVILEILYIT
jgi:hypothetical protein